jgi:hypothetical protein
MSLELLSVIAAIGTFMVIAATAIVAIIQLRHMRAGNQIAAIMQVSVEIESEPAQAARRFLRDELELKMHDPEFRKALRSVPIDSPGRPLVLLGNHYERLGLFIKRGIIDQDLACDLWSAQVAGDWAMMEPALAIIRRAQGDSVFENFEYFVDLSDQWFERHPHGTYKPGSPRRPLADPWLEVDREGEPDA